MTYDVGDQARLYCDFRNAITDALTDPTTVSVQVKSPTSTIIYTYGGGGTIVRDGTGEYRVDISVTSSGTWHYKWFGTGDLVAAEESTLFVRRSGV